MAAFDGLVGLSDRYDLTGGITQHYRGQTVIVIYAKSVDTGSTGYYDNYRHLEDLVKDFAHRAQVIRMRSFAGRRRDRIAGCDYRTPLGERPIWLRPEAPAEQPPAGVAFPRWREFSRRRG